MAPTDQGIARSYQSTHSRKGVEVKKFSSFGSSCPTLLDGWIKTAYIYCAAVLENINEVKIQRPKIQGPWPFPLDLSVFSCVHFFSTVDRSLELGVGNIF